MTVCVKFAYFPHVYVGFLRVLRFLPNSKYVRVKLIVHDKLSLNVRGIRRVNMWGYGDRTGPGWDFVFAGPMGQMASFCPVDYTIL